MIKVVEGKRLSVINKWKHYLLTEAEQIFEKENTGGEDKGGKERKRKE
jgi:hypothetical protein